MSSTQNAVSNPIVVPVTEASPKGRSLGPFADKALRASAGFWFVVVVLGQVIFAFATASFFGLTAARGETGRWSRVLTHGVIPGDRMGNTALVIHLASAVFIILSGAIQLVPQVRKLAPAFHRWNGRVYVVTAFTVSLAGLYLIWARGTVGGLAAHLGQSLDGVLIMFFAAIALRYAMARDFRTHRRWALRLYLVVSASLFIRASGIALAIPTPDFLSIFTLLSFAQYLVPLGVLELYLRAQERGGTKARIAVAGLLFVLTVGLGAGIAVATATLFQPRIKAAFDTRTSIGDVLAATIASSGIDTAIQQYHQLKAAPPANYNFDEAELNGLGYQLIAAKKIDEAIRVFQLNTEAYPKSGNVWDSLAEGYMDAGDKPLAIAYYQKSLAINPKNTNAVVMLKKMGAQ
jgi:hypothetical protein